MLTGLALLAVGAALLGYVVTGRHPAPRLSRPADGEQFAIGPEGSEESYPPEAPRTHSALSEAVLAPPPEESVFLEPALELPAPYSESRVVVSYETDGAEEAGPSPELRIVVTAAGDTDRGQRRSDNDDSLLMLPEHCLFAVADGMGGYAGGAVASSLAVETVRLAFEQNTFSTQLCSPAPIPGPGRELASAIVQAHEAVASAARADPEHSKMGTTLVAARFSPGEQRVYIGHVGDSRCYRLRHGRLRQLTRDQIMSTVGLMGPHADDLLQAVGVTVELSIDLIVDTPHPGDIYLLCSDGLNKMASDRQIQQILTEQRDLEAAVYGLIELANDAGGRDNVTVILVKVVDRAIHDLITIPSPPPEHKGWTTLPDVAPTERCSSDDETVVGQLPEGVALRLAPPTDRRGS